MNSKFMWILDNGHGKETPGKRSPKIESGKRLFEYEFNRDIISLLMGLLKDNGISFYCLVPEAEDVPLRIRVARANNLQSSLPKRFVSIHANAFGTGWNKVSGIETYCYRSGTQSEKLAGIFQHHLTETTQWRNIGIKEANFYVLKHTRMPAILTENGFYTNKQQCLEMMGPGNMCKIALGHFRAIREVEEQ